MKKKSYTSSILLLALILLVITVISENYFFRIDLTEGRQYSLSDATKDILKNLEEPVTITAWFTSELPPDLDRVRSEFKDLLVEYNSLSDGMVVYQFEDPAMDKESEANAMQQGIRPVLFNAREKDQISQQKIYMGAYIQLGDNSEVIPFVDPKGSIEYELSTAIKKLTVQHKPLVGFIQGQGEPGINEFQQAMKELLVLYDVKPVYLTDTTDLGSFKALTIMAPRDSFNVRQLKMLDNYLNQGGKLFIGMDRVKGDLQQASGTAQNTGLESWLQEKGLSVEESFVVDARCGTVGVSQRTGGFNMTTQIQFPYLPVLTNFATHPLTKGLEEVFLNFASPMKFSGNADYTFTPLMMTSELSASLPVPLYFNINKRWSKSDYPDKGLVVAGLLENQNNGRIIVITDGQFAVNGPGRQAHKVQKDNVNFLVNGIDWLSDDTGLIKLRTKSITSRPLEQISDSSKLLLKWLNFLLPVLLVVIYGLIRIQYRRNQRIKRMEKGYVQ
jgi:gliding-associated putative ABC transporter substrate-binding component GldG